MLKNLFKLIIKNNLLSFIGINQMNFDLLLYLKHYKWVFKIRKLPYFKIIYFKSNNQINENFINKIKLYYESEINYNKQHTSILWSDGLNKYSKELANSIINNKNISSKLNEIFLSDAIYGLASGSAFKYSKGHFGKKIWNAKYIDLIISLAEYLSLTRLESTQQGSFANYSKKNIIDILKSVELKISHSISFPNIGSPYGIQIIDKKLITFEDLEHLYAALRIVEYINLHKINKFNNINIVEIGGGYGGLCKWLIKLLDKNISNYTIVDLPLINIIQNYFLSLYFGEDKVNFKFNSKDKISIISPSEYFNNYKKSNFTIVINQNSMPEMNNKIVNNYLDSFIKKEFNYFFSFNHEAISTYKDNLQVSVREEVLKKNNYKLLNRNLSFMRTGYLEEIYSVN